MRRRLIGIKFAAWAEHCACTAERGIQRMLNTELIGMNEVSQIYADTATNDGPGSYKFEHLAHRSTGVTGQSFKTWKLPDSEVDHPPRVTLHRRCEETLLPFWIAWPNTQLRQGARAARNTSGLPIN
jgi:hypothetical protein